jgi:23S rRNA (guanosine2251-2'-O)-methyltransferase
VKNMKQYIYGKNTILEALRGEKNVYTVYIQNNLKDNKIIELCKRKKVHFELVDKSEFIKKLGNVKHQGVMAEVKEYRYYSIDEILNSIPEGKTPLLLMLDGLEDPHNLGAILRTCDALGVDGVIIGKNRSVGLNGTVAKVSTGAIDYVKVAQVTNLTRTLEDLKKRSFWIVGCDLDQSQDYRQVDYNLPLVIVIGSEGFGISRLVKKSCDFNVVLPMVGHVTSLNASVATAVILYQVYNSRNPL